MDDGRRNICIGMDSGFRHEKIAKALEWEICDNPLISYQIKNLDQHDWLEVVRSFDLIIWWPEFMGPFPASLFKEKIYVMEHFLKKIVIPNYSTIWHFESKIAQSYLFQLSDVVTPRTVVSFDYRDALEQFDGLDVPFVMKKSFGSASDNVRLIRDKKKARREIETIFYQNIWKATGDRSKAIFSRIIASIYHHWFWKKVWWKLTDNQSLGRKYGSVYLQEFIPGNKADLRITIIGDRFAFGYWRNNRPRDFRASGSGSIDYDRPIPKDAILYCIGISQKLGFDSMAYDLIFQGEKLLITEMSYSYVTNFIYRVKGFYEVDHAGEMVFHPQNTWPEEIWAKWALIRAGQKEPVTNLEMEQAVR